MVVRTPRIIATLNWRYALGEVVLIVLGILIALAISDWNDRRILRIQEKALLREVKTALESDLSELQIRLAELQATIPRIEELTRKLRVGMAYESSMDQLFGAAYGVHGINLNNTAYETLKSVGLQSISNTELRLRIARIYDHYYEKILMERDIDIGVTLEVMRPYYLRHFRNLRFLESATPVDFETIAGDTYFLNIVDYRLEVLRSNQSQSYPEAMMEIGVVLEMLEEELR